MFGNTGFCMESLPFSSVHTVYNELWRCSVIYKRKGFPRVEVLKRVVKNIWHTVKLVLGVVEAFFVEN